MSKDQQFLAEKWTVNRVIMTKIPSGIGFTLVLTIKCSTSELTLIVRWLVKSKQQLSTSG